jgi:carbamoyl-phosphate synthase small subunit
VPALQGLDTRALVRRLRDRGALRGVLTTERSDAGALAAELADFPLMAGRALVDEVTCAARYEIPAVGEERRHLAVYDFGVKTNILRSLTERGARLTGLPARTPASDVLALGADGVVLSNGPGDPAATAEYAGPEIRKLIASGVPILGICLGHQMLALALGAKTKKMPQGHHGANHPVKDFTTGKVEIVSMNHGFTVDTATLPKGVEESHKSLFDGTNCGLSVAGKPIISVQHHPEASPGPQDSFYLFERFAKMMAERRVA